jgi:hypothetical protein
VRLREREIERGHREREREKGGEREWGIFGERKGGGYNK